jgi:hypothetical protein
VNEIEASLQRSDLDRCVGVVDHSLPCLTFLSGFLGGSEACSEEAGAKLGDNGNRVQSSVHVKCFSLRQQSKLTSNSRDSSGFSGVS